MTSGAGRPRRCSQAFCRRPAPDATDNRGSAQEEAADIERRAAGSTLSGTYARMRVRDDSPLGVLDRPVGAAVRSGLSVDGISRAERHGNPAIDPSGATKHRASGGASITQPVGRDRPPHFAREPQRVSGVPPGGVATRAPRSVMHQRDDGRCRPLRRVQRPTGASGRRRVPRADRQYAQGDAGATG